MEENRRDLSVCHYGGGLILSLSIHFKLHTNLSLRFPSFWGSITESMTGQRKALILRWLNILKTPNLDGGWMTARKRHSSVVWSPHNPLKTTWQRAKIQKTGTSKYALFLHVCCAWDGCSVGHRCLFCGTARVTGNGTHSHSTTPWSSPAAPRSHPTAVLLGTLAFSVVIKEANTALKEVMPVSAFQPSTASKFMD